MAEWIKVEDRLPETKPTGPYRRSESDDVLVYERWGISVGRYLAPMISAGGQWLGSNWRTMENVTHWMPLPDNPEGK